MSSSLLSVEGVTKRYSEIPVLRDVSLSAASGEIVAVMGENGAGKSTLMKILAGVIAHGEYEGVVRLGGDRLRLTSPHDAEAAGVVMIPQELAVVPHLSVAENLLLNREPNRFGLIDSSALEAKARDILHEAGVAIDVGRPMRSLGLASQQLVEIVKALSKQARVLILDEPTASLSNSEAEHLFERLHDLRDRGHLCLYISHRIDEVLKIADRVVVLRDGEIAGDVPRDQTSREELVRMMLGRSVGDLFPPRADHGDEVVFRVEHLSVTDPIVPSRRLVDDVTFEIRRGEILGIFGLVGAGRTEIVSTLFGASPGAWTGSITIGREAARIRSPRDAIRHGLALVTEDRRRYGFIPEFGFATNASLASLPSISRWGWLDLYRERSRASDIAQELRLRAESLDQPVRTLSGGNQQKSVIAKWLATDPVVLMLDDPTRGIDVGAKADVYRFLAELSRRGVAILFISSEANELVGLAHRTLVMSRGRIIEECGPEVTEERILRIASGGAEPVGA